MSLANIYLHLHARAAETGEDRRVDLSGGARLSVRVQGGVTTLTISRKGKRVGDTELLTFKRECGVPAYASRYPGDDQGTRKDDDARMTMGCFGFLWPTAGRKERAIENRCDQRRRGLPHGARKNRGRAVAGRCRA